MCLVLTIFLLDFLYLTQPLYSSESTPATQLTFFFTQAPVLNRGYRDKEHTFLVTAVIPACALLILVLVVALIVACCLHHKRKMHVRRRRGIDKPKREFLEECGKNWLSKSPLLNSKLILSSVSVVEVNALISLCNVRAFV